MRHSKSPLGQIVLNVLTYGFSEWNTNHFALLFCYCRELRKQTNFLKKGESTTQDKLHYFS